MKFGVLYDFRNPPQPEWFMPWPEYYKRQFEHMAEMERIGFDAVSLAEHHGDPDGYNPAPMAALTGAALHTSRVKITTNIAQVVLAHPVRFAEEIAVIDQISNGRLDIGVGLGGRGFGTLELPMYGVNPKFRPSILEEALEIIRRAWSEDEPFDFEGKRFSYQGIWINPKPAQRPHPPIWLVGPVAAAAIDRAARFGGGVGALGGQFRNLTGDEEYRSWYGVWEEALERNGRAPGSAYINSFGSAFVTDDPERDWAKHREGAFYHFNYQRWNGVRPYSSVFMDHEPKVPEDMPSWDRLFITPEDAIKEITDLIDEGIAPDELHVMSSRAGMTVEESVGYMTAFAEKVLPTVRAHVVAKGIKERGANV